MKKYLVIILIIIITIICTVCVENIFSKKEKNNIISVYQLSENENTISDKSILQSKNLKIALKGFYSSEINNEQLSNLALENETIDNILKFSNNNKYNLLFNFSTTNNENIIEPTYDSLVYDNLGNVIMTSVVYEKKSEKDNQLLKYFLENEHNTDNLLEFSDYNLSGGTTKNIVNDTDNSNLILISSSLNSNMQKELDLSKIHILISNISYKTKSSNERTYLDNTIFEFTIEK